MDARVRCAVDASIGWYEDVCATHGIGSLLVDGLWSSLEPAPPLHSDAVVVEPAVGADQVVERLREREHGGVKDSFATLNLSGHGYDGLFRATWLHRRATGSTGAQPAGWSVVSTVVELVEWNASHDTTGVLLPALLRRGHLKVLAKRAGGRLVAGAVARLGSGVVELSNVWASPRQELNWDELVVVVSRLFPGRPVTGYERGDALRRAVDAGFDPVGELRVWVR